MKRKDRRMALDTGVASHIRTFHDPQGIDAEGFRLLRTMLLLRAKNEQLQTIAITSANPSDGKSTILANLAVSIANLDKRVLLIDGDMRRPTVKTTFNLTADAGLSDCLLGEVEASEATFPTAQNNLWIMPHGSSVPNPAELLQSMRMEWLLEQLKAHYDFVLIDLPPILAVTDPLVVAQQMDGFLMAARITKNGRKPVESAARRIQSTGAKMLGVVVNGAEKKTSSYGYSNYSESYRYGYVKEYHKQYEASRA